MKEVLVVPNGVLLVSIGFSPNVGGIETHFDDLVEALSKEKIRNWVLTYKPITTKVQAPFFEKRGNYTEIYRVPWISGIFYNLVKNPIAEFLYLVPGLFITLPILLLLKRNNINTIHSHGLIAGFVSVFWGSIFNKKVIVTTHSIYNFPKSGFYRKFSTWIFNNSDTVLTLSEQSKNEVKDLDISEDKIKVFTYWINLKIFKEVTNAKERLGWSHKFVVLFVGRLVPEKGLDELLRSFKNWDKKVTLVIIGAGPFESRIQKIKKDNFVYVGKVKNDKLPIYYSAADLLIVPSTSEEGFGRVILESLACGTPVIGSNRGAISEAMDNSVGKLINITPESIENTVRYFYRNSDKLKQLSKNTRYFVEKRYSEKNVETIIKSYK